MIKKVITTLDLSQVSGPDCILVVILNNCDPEITFILAEIFNKSLKESSFSDCWKVSLWSLYLIMLGKSLSPQTATLLVFFLWLFYWHYLVDVHVN